MSWGVHLYYYGMYGSIDYARRGMTMRERTQLKKVRVNGTELHYVEQGEGDSLVFVHGGLGDFRTWGPQMGPFSGRYHVVSYSRRGHYPNAWPEDYSSVEMMPHVEDLAALIEKL